MFVFRKMLRTYLMDDPNVPKLPNNRYFFNAMNQKNIIHDTDSISSLTGLTAQYFEKSK